MIDITGQGMKLKRLQTVKATKQRDKTVGEVLKGLGD